MTAGQPFLSYASPLAPDRRGHLSYISGGRPHRPPHRQQSSVFSLRSTVLSLRSPISIFDFTNPLRLYRVVLSTWSGYSFWRVASGRMSCWVSWRVRGCVCLNVAGASSSRCASVLNSPVATAARAWTFRLPSSPSDLRPPSAANAHLTGLRLLMHIATIHQGGNRCRRPLSIYDTI